MLKEEYQQQIISVIKGLPEEKLIEVNDFASFLKQKYHQQSVKKRIVKLGGLWEGFEPGDEEIKASSRKIWKHLDDKEIP